VSFVFRRNLYLASGSPASIASLSLDFGAGQGYQSATWEQPISNAYASAGTKRIKVRVVYNTPTGSETRESWFDLRVLNDPPVAARYDPNNPVRRVDYTVPFAATYSGSGNDPNFLTHKGAKVSVCYSQGHTQLVKPFIVVEGYNTTAIAPHLVGVNNRNNDVEGFLKEIDRSAPFDFNDQLDLAHYDIVYIDFNEGTDDIRRNAALFQRVVQWVNTHKTLDPTTNTIQQNVVMGESMGGLVARYGLARMVRAGQAHDTRLLVLHDSPQRGANNPLGVQALALQSVFPITVAGGITIYPGAFVDRLGESLAILNAPATRQLAILSALSPSGAYAGNTFIEGPYKDVVDFSTPPPGTPVPTYGIIATSDGSQCGRAQNTAPHTELIRNNTNWMYAPVTSVGPRHNFYSEAIANALPAYGVRDRIAHLRVWTQYRIRIFTFTVATINITLSDTDFPAPANTLPYETLPGGTENPADQSDVTATPSTNYFNIYSFASTSTLYNGPICFVPTYSALDVPTVLPTTAFAKYINSATDNPSKPRVFPYIAMEQAGTTFNQPHLRFTARNSEWIFRSMEGLAMPANFCSAECEVPAENTFSGPATLCGPTTYSPTDRGPGYSYTWTTNPPNLFSPPVGTGLTFTTSNNGDGQGTITLQIDGPCPKTITRPVNVGAPLEPIAEWVHTDGVCDNNMAYYHIANYAPALTYSISNRVAASGAAPAGPDFWVKAGGGTLTGSFTLTATTNGCGSRSADYNVSYPPCEGPAPTYTLSPNPADDYVTVEEQTTASARNPTASSASSNASRGISALHVYDSYGQLRATQPGNGASTVRLRTRALPVGLYVVHILSGQAVVSRQHLEVRR